MKMNDFNHFMRNNISKRIVLGKIIFRVLGNRLYVPMFAVFLYMPLIWIIFRKPPLRDTILESYIEFNYGTEFPFINRIQYLKYHFESFDECGYGYRWNVSYFNWNWWVISMLYSISIFSQFFFPRSFYFSLK